MNLYEQILLMCESRKKIKIGKRKERDRKIRQKETNKERERENIQHPKALIVNLCFLLLIIPLVVIVHVKYCFQPSCLSSGTETMAFCSIQTELLSLSSLCGCLSLLPRCLPLQLSFPLLLYPCLYPCFSLSSIVYGSLFCLSLISLIVCVSPSLPLFSVLPIVYLSLCVLPLILLSSLFLSISCLL